ncbi:E3 ubiquitin-protein ligase ATL41-like [Quillaja saponaria]|uniref:E3 ubiquitin-protein ligase ATL41-like n=1 Tax=Quillaja saponaria TaxID=32244 RepID=A0AAD7LVA5_QUISA|nr:E3 ubiquitin-protein ligase ATL41-like [Quillaja saponaria]
MEEFDIAILKADLLLRLRNWGHYSNFDGSYDPRTYSGELSEEEFLSIRSDTMIAELAVSRARATNQDFQVVLKEVEFKVMVELARILAKTTDSDLASTFGFHQETTS